MQRLAGTDRESMEFDVVIVGAGPAGLAAAIRIKQKAPHVSVVIVEKGAEVGAHILSGAVMDPSGLDALIPDWRARSHPPVTAVTKDQFFLLTKSVRFAVPGFLLPPFMSNHGNFIGSLGEICKWLAREAEALGVEIYPGIAAAELLYSEDGAVIGIATGDMGVTAKGTAGPSYAQGMALLGKYVLIAEGVRGFLAQQLISRFGLDEDHQPTKYGIGIKELWEVPVENHEPGLIQHSIGWPLDAETGGGSFLYHFADNKVAVGFVVHLNYTNPYLSPFEEFQRFKTHPSVAPTFRNARRTGYGARAISEGGWQSVPKLTFPGGALLGCAAGLVNLPRIKGSHNAIHSGILAADDVVATLADKQCGGELAGYEKGWRGSAIGADLFPVRNVKPLWSRFGSYAGLMLAGMDMWSNSIFRGWSPFGTLSHGSPDHTTLVARETARKIAYPKPDGILTFDRLSSVYLSNTNHSEDQPCHLKVLDADLQKRSELDTYDGPSQRYCPAAVYEWTIDPEGRPQFVVNAQNCVHCKTCDIKDPNQNIVWVPPQGGEGPSYPAM